MEQRCISNTILPGIQVVEKLQELNFMAREQLVWFSRVTGFHDLWYLCSLRILNPQALGEYISQDSSVASHRNQLF